VRAAVLCHVCPVTASYSRMPLQIMSRMLWICTTVQREHGRRLNSVWRAMIMQLYLLVAWFCSLGVPQPVRCCSCFEAGMFMVASVWSVCACCRIMVMFPLRPRFLSCALQTSIPMLWMCTTVQRGHGRRLSSVWRAIILQLPRSGAWLCSLGVLQEVRCCGGRIGMKDH
jgi:hypothetical protein